MDNNGIPVEYRQKIHTAQGRDEIKTDGWLDVFAHVIDDCRTPILDLGCGSGNDALYLIEKNKQVISCDISDVAVENVRKNLPELLDAKCFDMLDGLPFEDGSFDLVIADLCLHYFSEKDTFGILDEIRRVLVPGGRLIARVNSTKDVNYGAGKGDEIERHFYKLDGGDTKRFFDEKDVRYFLKDYESEYINEETMTRYVLEKVVFTFCAAKKEM